MNNSYRLLLLDTVKSFRRSEGGNVAIIFALASLTLVSLIGMSADYTIAGRRQAQLNAIADAAALSTTTPASMSLTSAQAQAIAVTMFNAQASLVKGASYLFPNPVIGVNDVTNSNGSVTRSTTVSYAGTSSNAFSQLLRMNTMNIGGTSAVSSSTAPNIDFYVLLDTSPSMGIPSSQAGINTLIANTQQQGSAQQGWGCAFACHETNPIQSDVAGNPKGTGAYANGVDNYTLAKTYLGLTLRIDLVQQAVANLYSTALATESKNKAQYRVATYTFDQSFQTITNLTSNLATAQSQTANIKMLQVYAEHYLNGLNANNDEDTQFDSAMANTTYIPNPGQGTNAIGDTPQEILFIVTDGVIDEAYPGYGSTNDTVSGRTIAPVGNQLDYCTPLKNRHVRIAILYTPYLPLTTNQFYETNVAPVQTQIPTALINCASPGLFFQVNSDTDINSAMQALFAAAVGSAHLTK